MTTMASANALIPINDTVPDPTLQEGMKTEGDFLDEEEGQKEAAPANKKGDGKNPDKRPASRARELRLEQNRKAAKESRRRKKMMIEELQRSVIFFSRANGALKQQNDELGRLMMQAQAQVVAIESGQQMGQKPVDAQQPQMVPVSGPTPSYGDQSQQVQAQAVATQAALQAQGFPPAAARHAAQTINGAAPTPHTHTTDTSGVAQMQPGSTMQAMAAFQQATAVAMQAAIPPSAMQAAMGMNPVAPNQQPVAWQIPFSGQHFVSAPGGVTWQAVPVHQSAASVQQQPQTSAM